MKYFLSSTFPQSTWLKKISNRFFGSVGQYSNPGLQDTKRGRYLSANPPPRVLKFEMLHYSLKDDICVNDTFLAIKEM